MKIIITHKNSDFDAVASLIAASLVYEDSYAILPSTINPNVRNFVSIHKDIFRFYDFKEIDLEKIDTIIVVDTNSWHRIENGKIISKLEKCKIIRWDHHPKGDIKADVEHCDKKGATITILLKHIRSTKKNNLDSVYATLFLIALYEDTGSLTFLNTTIDDVYTAAYLLENGADLSVMEKFLKILYAQEHKDILSQMLNESERIKINDVRVSIRIVFLTDYITNLSVVVNMYRQITNVDVAVGIFINKERKTCFIIGRSDSPMIDVGKIMTSFNGGGHPGAGSAFIKGSVNPEEIKNTIMALIEGNQESSIFVEDLMSYPVHEISSDTTMKELEKEFKIKGVSGFPVVEGKRLCGVISIRDFKKIKQEKQFSMPVKAFMSNKVITIETGKSPRDVANLMIKHDIGRVIVVEDGKILGLISRSDIMKHFYALMPYKK